MRNLLFTLGLIPCVGLRLCAQAPELKTHAAPTGLPLAATQTIRDAKSHVSLQLPPGWDLSRKDGELSTFRLDARSAPRAADLRLVANLGSNPYPQSTFSGALFYLSIFPRVSAAACAAQTTRPPMRPLGTATVADVAFSHGREEHGKICTEAHDDVYTAMRDGVCVRFDIAINNFCGGEVSGAQDLTREQLNAIEARLQDILNTVRFTGRQ